MNSCEWELEDASSGARTESYRISCRDEHYSMYRFDYFIYCPFCGEKIKRTSLLDKIIESKLRK